MPPLPGEYAVTVQTSTSTETRYLFVDGEFDVSVGVERRYVDRVDDCEVLVMTDHGKLVCEKNLVVSIYDTDGGLHERFPGGALGVLGNEVWSTFDGGVEHRTDTSTLVRFDGAFLDELVGVENDVSGSVFEAGRSIRASPSGAVEVLWDGVALSAGRRVERLKEFDSYSYPFFEGSTLWTSSGCTWAPGCGTMTCTSVVKCDGVNEYVRKFQTITRERVVFAESTGHPAPVTFATARRPLISGAITREFERTVPEPGFIYWFHTINSGLRPRAQTYQTQFLSPRSVEPVITEHGMYLLYMNNVRTAQPKRNLVVLDPFTLRVVPM